MSDCPPGEIIGAVLGTFFGTLLLCGILVGVFVAVSRRRTAQQQNETRRRSTEIGDKKYVTPPAVKVYNNSGFVESESYESQRTLPLRQAQLVHSAIVPLERNVIKAKANDDENEQESIVQLVLGKQDGIGLGFEVCSESNSSGSSTKGVYVSEVLPDASNLLQAAMRVGDEILSIRIEVTRDLSVSDVRAILRQAADCPIKLTLRCRRKRSAPIPASTATVHAEHSHGVFPMSTSIDMGDWEHVTTATSPQLDLGQPDNAGNEAEMDKNLEHHTEEQPLAGCSRLTRWKSGPISSTEEGYNVYELAKAHPAHSGYAVEVLLGRASSLNSIDLCDNPAIVRSSTNKSSSNPATSDDEPFVEVVVKDCLASRSDNITNGLDAKFHHSPDAGSFYVPDDVNVVEMLTVDAVPEVIGQLEMASDDDAVDSYENIDHADCGEDSSGVDRAVEAGKRTVNRTGLDRALRAKERASRGGMAYYIDLEPRFDQLPGQ